ncbi:MAG: glycosyltransferase family 4 protein [Pseudomonadota bacterium]
MIRIAYASVPKESGTFTFYRTLREPLARHGVELLCVSVGRKQARLTNPSFVDEGCVCLAPHTENIRDGAAAFIDWCGTEKIDVAIGINTPEVLSALPHLPATTAVVARCANGFDHGYRITLAGGARAARIVALTPRLYTALLTYRAPAERLCLIPNGLDLSRFSKRPTQPADGPLRLCVMGRLEHRQKGVLHLPKIFAAVRRAGVPATLTIAGQGRHKGALERAFRAEVRAGLVRFKGLLTPHEVPNFLAGQDVFLFPSHFEGCPNALLEALAAGTVPVAFEISGTTDFLVKDGVTGILAPMGDTDAMAAAIGLLAHRPTLQHFSAAAQSAAEQRFHRDGTAARYAAIFREALTEKVPPPLPFTEFAVNENFAKPLATRILHRAMRALGQNRAMRAFEQ